MYSPLRVLRDIVPTTMWNFEFMVDMQSCLHWGRIQAVNGVKIHSTDGQRFNPASAEVDFKAHAVRASSTLW
jgi:hypothetical protein